MLNRLKEIEKGLMGICAEIKEEIPATNCLSFTISHKSSKPYLYGFLHVGDECIPFNDIAELAALVTEAKKRGAENEILYQQFKGVV